MIDFLNEIMNTEIVFYTVLVLNIIGTIWLGIILKHFIIIPLGWFILLLIINFINEKLTAVFFFFIIGLTFIAIIIQIFRGIILKRKKKELELKNSALLDAVIRGDKRVAQDMISAGANFYIMKEQLLKSAIENYNKEIVTLLLVKMQDVNVDMKEQLLKLAIENHDKEIVSLLLQKGANVEIKEQILKTAIENYDKEIVSLLLQNGEENWTRGEVEKQLLKAAVDNHDKEIVSFLLKKGVYVNSLYNGQTLLDYADDKEIIQILKSHDAKTKIEIDKEHEESVRRSEERARQLKEDLRQKINSNKVRAIIGGYGTTYNKLLGYWEQIASEWGKVYDTDGNYKGENTYNSAINSLEPEVSFYGMDIPRRLYEDIMRN